MKEDSNKKERFMKKPRSLVILNHLDGLYDKIRTIIPFCLSPPFLIVYVCYVILISPILVFYYIKDNYTRDYAKWFYSGAYTNNGKIVQEDWRERSKRYG